MHDYDLLTPDLVIDAVEEQGFLSDARIFPLNSYENRVYQVGIEEADPIVAKFYRPHRWSDEAIQEEHDFSWELAERDIPIIPPIRSAQQKTLHHHANFRFGLFVRRGGQSPEPGDLDQLFRIGRLMGRIHTVGASQTFQHRATLSIEQFCHTPSQFLLENQFVPSTLKERYQRVCENIIQICEQRFTEVNGLEWIRCHGDCHLGNIIWHRDLGPFFVDMDDCMMAPAVQDIWMLLSGNRADQTAQLCEVLDGYSEFADFNSAELALVEPLRAMRMIHYAGWLGKRWTDPAFPMHFPWFNTDHYWLQHIGELEEQLAMLGEPPLVWFG